MHRRGRGHDRRLHGALKLFTWDGVAGHGRLLSRRIWPGSIRRRSSQCPLVRDQQRPWCNSSATAATPSFTATGVAAKDLALPTNGPSRRQLQKSRSDLIYAGQAANRTARRRYRPGGGGARSSIRCVTGPRRGALRVSTQLHGPGGAFGPLDCEQRRHGPISLSPPGRGAGRTQGD